MNYCLSKSALEGLLTQCLLKHGSMAKVREFLDDAGKSSSDDLTVSEEFIAMHELSGRADRDDIVATAAGLAAEARAQSKVPQAASKPQERAIFRPPRWPLAIVAILTFIAIGDLPYGYYQTLRWVVCGAAIVVGIQMHSAGRSWLMRALAVVALIFNPLVRFHFAKETWCAWNILAGITILSAAFTGARRKDGR